MDRTHEAADAQAARWKGSGADAWVAAQTYLDAMYRPFAELLVESAAAHPGRVLDVGCGTGATTVAMARELGAGGECVGVDISETMVGAARDRAGRDGSSARFVCADAEEYDFGSAAYDLVVSRFGVMFFGDPVRAFGNLRRAAADDARLRFVVWRGMEENPFMTTAARAAAPLVPSLPVRKDGDPGQFGLADPDRTGRLLRESGWTSVDARPVEAVCTLPESELDSYLTRFGVLGTVLPDLPETTRARVVETVRAAFEPYVHGDEVRFTAACWVVDASAGDAPGR
ncbi:Demethylmenaquinone methyltransferase [Streptomyces sp. YIM 130001]|uniref:class I SAM-dependent methyltransferase n=1 Tax=Streptomyces sp. YIM 130001 TaxID=2259644 RepID=UPI000E652BE9|nr:class I SAM-dependent methyltransferase [Streptomyces sp. YIM 130001]RII15107.1 Demethylmenaquinone methyltransferase [Streptomyces sp. YIM 130001]